MSDKRLIDANTLREIVDERATTAYNDMTFGAAVAATALDGVLEAIDAAPTIVPETLRPQWISTKKMLPEHDKDVLVYTTLYCGTITVATFERSGGSLIGKEGGLWFLYMDDEGAFATSEEVTHWMPLPEPPKEE